MVGCCICRVFSSASIAAETISETKDTKVGTRTDSTQYTVLIPVLYTSSSQIYWSNQYLGFGSKLGRQIHRSHWGEAMVNQSQNLRSCGFGFSQGGNVASVQEFLTHATYPHAQFQFLKHILSCTIFVEERFQLTVAALTRCSVGMMWFCQKPCAKGLQVPEGLDDYVQKASVFTPPSRAL